MFKNALKKNYDSVKPMINGYKTPYSDEVLSGIGTIVVINDEGWILTCRHIAENIIAADKIMEKYADIKEELIANKIPPKKIYKKYGVSEEDAVIFRNVFLNVTDSWTGLNLFIHKTLDLALIKFENVGEIFCKKYPVFAKKNPEPGEYVCRIGYPYPDMECFRYDHTIRDIVIKEGFDSHLQPFPSDGMVTRNLLDETGKLSIFEMTNPSMYGQSGGSIVNKDGYIVGITFGSATKDIGIDVEASVRRGTKYTPVKETIFMNFGLGINVEAIKEFLDENKVKYEIEK